MRTLTNRQQAIYDFIVEQVQERGIPPSLTEIARAFGLASASGIADHLNAIERKGYIRRRPGMSRGIELIDVDSRPSVTPRAVRVPVVGTIPGSRHLGSATRTGRHLLLDGRVAPGRAIAVLVKLNGLEQRGILRGDYVVVLRGRKPRPGDLALADLGRGITLVEVLSGRRRARRIDTDSELKGGFEVLGRVVAVLRSIDEATET